MKRFVELPTCDGEQVIVDADAVQVVSPTDEGCILYVRETRVHVNAPCEEVMNKLLHGPYYHQETRHERREGRVT